MTFEISQVMCFGKSLVWYDLCVKLRLNRIQGVNCLICNPDSWDGCIVTTIGF